MTGRLAAPEIVIIEGWEVIMHQGGRMKGFKGRNTPQAPLRSTLPTKVSRNRKGQQGTQPLPTPH
jgi:hypothetical protein